MQTICPRMNLYQYVRCIMSIHELVVVVVVFYVFPALKQTLKNEEMFGAFGSLDIFIWFLHSASFRGRKNSVGFLPGKTPTQ